MALVPIDHIKEGTDRVISQYRNKPLLMQRIACYLNLVQQVEDAAQAVLAAFNVDTATGFRLVWIGKKVGQTPIGSTDDIFRKFIKARIRANRSLGQVKDIQDIARMVLTDWHYYELAQVVIIETSDQLDLETAEAVQGLLQRAASAGVRVRLVWGELPDQFDFLFTDDLEGMTVNGGFDTEPSNSNAGLWASDL